MRSRFNDRALVVGCDAYPNVPGGDLRAAVADAAAVREWLVDPRGGGIAAANLTFLASPGPCSLLPSPGGVHGPADVDTLAEALQSLLRATDVTEQDRLYVYFAGHGCRTDPGNAALSRDALAFTNFSPINPSPGTVGVADLRVRLEQTRFGTVVLIMDACRDFPFESPFQLGGLGLDPRVVQTRRYQPRTYVGQATIVGGSATASVAGPAIGGRFTRALLDGLRGEGAAKVFDETQDRPYVVSWTSLRRFVEAAAPDARLGGDGDVTLATFPDGWFDAVRLEVDVDPHAVAFAQDLRIRVHYSNLADDDGELELTGPVPVSTDVPPRRHKIVATGADHHGKQWVDVYANTRVRVITTTGPDRQRAVSPPERVMRENGIVDGVVEVLVDDPVAAVDVRRLDGELVAGGIGQVTAPLPPGHYLVVALSVDGREITEIADVDAGLVSPLRLTVPGATSYLRSALAAVPELGWGSGAALLAASRPPPLPDRTRLTVAVPAGTTPAQLGPAYSGEAVPQVDPDAGAVMGWVTSAEAPTGRDTRVVIAGTAMTVPTLPGTATTVFLGSDALVVGLFDRDVLLDPKQLLLFDRAQRYAAHGRFSSARQLLDSMQRGQPGAARTALADLVESAPDRPLHPALLAAANPDKRVRAIGGGPWKVVERRRTT